MGERMAKIILSVQKNNLKVKISERGREISYLHIQSRLVLD